MTLLVTVFVQEGIVMAADSRLTIDARHEGNRDVRVPAIAGTSFSPGWLPYSSRLVTESPAEGHLRVNGAFAPRAFQHRQ
jgi:hypothetical protein